MVHPEYPDVKVKRPSPWQTEGRGWEGGREGSKEGNNLKETETIQSIT